MGFKSWIRQRKKSKKNDLSSDAESNPRSALKVEDVKSGQENEPELDTPGTRLESVGEVKENTEVEPDVPPPTAFKDGFPVPDTKSDKDDSAATAEEPVTFTASRIRRNELAQLLHRQQQRGPRYRSPASSEWCRRR